jgi:hypothetical protein
MALGSIAKKLFRILTRVIPQCGMVSQAVAFNMFLAFFPILLVALGLMSSSLRGKSGPELLARLSAILPPGSWQLVSDSLVRREVNPWNWVLLGWVGTLLVGTQVKAHHGGHSLNLRRSTETLLSRPANSGLAIVLRVDRCVAQAVAWSVIGRPLCQWMSR